MRRPSLGLRQRSRCRRDPLHGFAPGQPVLVRAKAGTPLGTAYVNPHTLICARLVSRDPKEPFGRPLIFRRLQQALGLRERLFRDPYYRLVYGEGDFLPGLIVDRYGGVLVVQLNTAGMERAEAEVIDALMEVVAPEVILLRNDSPARRIEGLDTHVRTASGVVPEDVALTEHGARFEVPLAGGQKTGWYYDHRENRERMLRYAGALGSSMPSVIWAHGASRRPSRGPSASSASNLRRSRPQASPAMPP